MRRIPLVAALAVAFVIVGAPSCQPAEPAMTIAVTPDSARPPCWDNAYITGTVAPFAATKTVVLQRTVKGKWVDWQWHERDSDPTVGLVTATVQQYGAGVFEMGYLVPGSTTTMHLRIRSAGGGYVSPGFYVTPGDSSCD